MVEGGNAGKRINVCIASTLPDWGSNGWMMVEFYVNGQFVHFLVCGQPNLALTRRYSRIFTGAISPGVPTAAERAALSAGQATYTLLRGKCFKHIGSIYWN